MSCGHLYALEAGLEHAFTIDASRVTFGHGALREVAARARAYGERIAVFTDPRVRVWLPELGLDDAAVFDAVEIEPTDASIDLAARFARDAAPDVYVSLGGGSVIDTAKLANLLATCGGKLTDYVNAPIGRAVPVPRPLAPHVACPTTSGTGSEVTGIAIFDLLALHAKTGVASPRLRPAEAIVDPRTTSTLPASVVAASGLDVLCHAIESYTARPFTQRTPTTPRPMSQGANPWSDLGCREALRLCGAHLVAAVAGDAHAREQMMWAATLAGIAFGNAGVHAPHAMAYAVAGRAEAYVAHGFAVAVSAPAVLRRFADSAPDRHREAAALLGAEVATIMRTIGAPNGLAGVGYTAADVPALVASAAPQRRLLDNAPVAVTPAVLEALFHDALTCW